MDALYTIQQDISKTLEDFRIQILKNQMLRQQEWEELMEKRNKRNQTLENLAPPSKSVWKPPDLCAKPSLKESLLREEEFSELPKSRHIAYSFIRESMKDNSTINGKLDEKEISNTFEDYHTQIQRSGIIRQQRLTELAEKFIKRNPATLAETLESPWISNENPLNLSARLILKEFHADETHHNTDEEEKKASLVAEVPCSPRVTNLKLLSGDDSPRSSIGDYGVEKSPTERLLPKSILEQGDVGAVYKVWLKGNSTAQVGGKSTVDVEFSPMKHKSELINFVEITLFNRKVGTQDVIVVENSVFDPGTVEVELWEVSMDLTLMLETSVRKNRKQALSSGDRDDNQEIRDQVGAIFIATRSVPDSFTSHSEEMALVPEVGLGSNLSIDLQMGFQLGDLNDYFEIQINDAQIKLMSASSTVHLYESFCCPASVMHGIIPDKPALKRIEFYIQTMPIIFHFSTSSYREIMQLTSTISMILPPSDSSASLEFKSIGLKVSLSHWPSFTIDFGTTCLLVNLEDEHLEVNEKSIEDPEIVFALESSVWANKATYPKVFHGLSSSNCESSLKEMQSVKGEGKLDGCYWVVTKFCSFILNCVLELRLVAYSLIPYSVKGALLVLGRIDDLETLNDVDFKPCSDNTIIKRGDEKSVPHGSGQLPLFEVKDTPWHSLNNEELNPICYNCETVLKRIFHYELPLKVSKQKCQLTHEENVKLMSEMHKNESLGVKRDRLVELVSVNNRVIPYENELEKENRRSMKSQEHIIELEAIFKLEKMRVQDLEENVIKLTVELLTSDNMIEGMNVELENSSRNVAMKKWQLELYISEDSQSDSLLMARAKELLGECESLSSTIKNYETEKMEKEILKHLEQKLIELQFENKQLIAKFDRFHKPIVEFQSRIVMIRKVVAIQAVLISDTTEVGLDKLIIIVQKTELEGSGNRSPTNQKVYSFSCFSATAIVARRWEYSYLGVDTQDNIEGAHLGILDYVKHALTLFTDFVAVFVRLLIIMLESVGGKIVNKCEESIMQYKRNVKGWMDVLNSNLWELQETEELLSSLMLSYHLPSAMKQCFLFGIFFPKSHNTDADNLIHLWMTHDYLTAIENVELVVIGRKHLESPVMRSLFQYVEEDKDGKRILSFKIHDRVHELVQDFTKEFSLTELAKNLKQGSMDRRFKIISFRTLILGDKDLLKKGALL